MEFWAQLQVINPEVWMSVFAMAVLLTELVFHERQVLGLLSGVSVIIAAVLTVLAPQGVAFGGMFIADNYAFFFKMIFFLSALLTIFLSIRYLGVEEMDHGEYFSLILFSTLGMMIMASAGDLVLLYLGLELMALSTYVLTGIRRLNIRSTEAALKYFMLGAFSSAILLYGISIVYALTGTTNISEIARKIVAMSLADGGLMLVGVVFLIVSFGFKLATVPFHMWAPDVYEGAPTPITAFMSVGPKAAAFAVLARVFIVGLEPLSVDWKFLLSIIAVLTMGVGNIMALSQTNLKRMLAYSSIAHAGYALLGVIAGTAEGVASMMNYLLIYAFMNIGAFAVIILLTSYESEAEQLSDYEGLAKTHPVLSAIMLVFMFSLTGIPPTAGFWGKFYLFIGAINAGYTWLAIVAVVFSAISAYFYLRVVMLMYMRDPQRRDSFIPSPTESMALFCTVVMVVLIGILPSYFLDLARASFSL